MFLDFYGLKEQPFGITPDPRFLYLSAAHREALASLYYGIDAGCGFVALIAGPGMGKTTLLFQLLRAFRSSARTTFLFETQCTSREFMRFLLLELGCEIEAQRDLVSMHREFNRCLLQEARAGRRFIVIIDEAQNLRPSVLETVRLLSNFETPKAKQLQIILAGQPELADKLARPSLRQLRQRISVLSGLPPLPPQEVERYIDHRMRIAGSQSSSIFTPEARKIIAERSQGIPRNVNNICFSALSLGCALRQRILDTAVVQQAVDDFDLRHLVSEPHTTTLESESAVSRILSAKDEPMGNRITPVPAVGGALNPIEALAYIQEVVLALNNRYRAN